MIQILYEKQKGSCAFRGAVPFLPKRGENVTILSHFSIMRKTSQLCCLSLLRSFLFCL